MVNYRNLEGLGRLQYKHSVVVAYVDFSKAFDTVCHNKLFVRLASCGIGGALLEWLRQFFCNRSHQTELDHHYRHLPYCLVELCKAVE